MAYIGKQPVVGNFQKCDAITVVNGQAAYTMQVGGVNVNPESENHMLVSLNGVLQAPVDSFTISGSTITFASNLATGDVIDFIMLLGNVLDLGTPSDNTVSLAKLTATGTKDATTFLRGDNTFAAAGGANTPAFYAHNTSATSCSASAHTKIIFDTEIFDSDGKFDNSASRFTPTVAGKYFVSSQISLASAQDGANYRNELYKNGSLYAQSQDWMYGGDYTTNLNSVVDLDTDDYIEIFVYHNSAGGTKNTVTTNKANFFSAFRIIT
jgi:hypothetical protein